MITHWEQSLILNAAMFHKNKRQYTYKNERNKHQQTPQSSWVWKRTKLVKKMRVNGMSPMDKVLTMFYPSPGLMENTHTYIHSYTDQP